LNASTDRRPLAAIRITCGYAWLVRIELAREPPQCDVEFHLRHDSLERQQLPPFRFDQQMIVLLLCRRLDQRLVPLRLRLAMCIRPHEALALVREPNFFSARHAPILARPNRLRVRA
jgi:hypothetical protein